MKIALIHADYENVNPKILELNPRADKHAKRAIDSIYKALVSGGHEVYKVKVDINLLRNVAKTNCDLIFCHYTPMQNLSLQGNVFAALEILGIPIVGSGMFSQAVGLSKETTKIIAKNYGIRTTNSQLFYSPLDELDSNMEFPLFVKPESEALSVGIRNDSYVENEAQLRETLSRLFKEVNPPILVEEYLSGREFTVGVLERNPILALPVMELKFSKGIRFRSLESVNNKDSMEKVFPEDLDESLINEMKEMSIKTFKALRCDVYGRADIRLDSKGNPYLMEFNTMPGLMKGGSFIETEANKIGIEFDELINEMVDITVKKHNDNIRIKQTDDFRNSSIEDNAKSNPVNIWIQKTPL